jgi:catechol 2,3-dioxygenase-like lactoylglutathione lyase family enzyme
MRPVLTHIALHVRDLDACVAFYRRFCGLEIVHERAAREAGERIYWLAEPGREREFIFVLLPGGPGRDQAAHDFSHFGFRAGQPRRGRPGRRRGRGGGLPRLAAAPGALSGRLLLRAARPGR